MNLNRRRLFAVMAAGSAASVASPQPARTAPSLWEQARSGLRPEGREDQTSALQRAVDESARTRKPLVLTAGVYRASGLKLPAGAQVWGTRGATTLVLSRPGASLISANPRLRVFGSTRQCGIKPPGGGQQHQRRA